MNFFKKLVKILGILLLSLVVLITLLVFNVRRKDSRIWVEKHRFDAVYSVYPTEDARDLFKLFPNGFYISQRYITSEGRIYDLDVNADSKTQVIKGAVTQDPLGDQVKVADVTYDKGHLIFTNSSLPFDWPTNHFIFQRLCIDQKLLDSMADIYYSYDEQTGAFSVEYEPNKKILAQSPLETDKTLKDFRINGMGEDYNRGINVAFDYSEKLSFIETLEKKGD